MKESFGKREEKGQGKYTRRNKKRKQMEMNNSFEILPNNAPLCKTTDTYIRLDFILKIF